jgi:hypothetical protein
LELQFRIASLFFFLCLCTRKPAASSPRAIIGLWGATRAIGTKDAIHIEVAIEVLVVGIRPLPCLGYLMELVLPPPPSPPFPSCPLGS